MPNRVTGKSPPGPQYAAATVAHGETVRADVLILSPAGRDGAADESLPAGRGRAGACPQSDGPVRRSAGRVVPAAGGPADPAADPGRKFDELFAALGSHRDRALLAFWVSTG